MSDYSESEDEWAEERGVSDEELAPSDTEESNLARELATIPFSSLLKAKKKLNKTSKLQQLQEQEDQLQEHEQESEGRARKRVKLSETKEQERRPNGSLRKKDRASKHA